MSSFERLSGNSNKMLCLDRNRAAGYVQLDADHCATEGNVFSKEGLTEEQIEEFRDAFSTFDRDQSGYITTKELAHILRSLGLNPTEKQLCQLINEVDFDGNGKIDFIEFVNMMLMQGDDLAWNENDLIEAFRTFDVDDLAWNENDLIEAFR